MVNELPDDKAMLDLAKQARLAISYQAPFQQDSAFADWLTTSYKMGYRNGRGDCLRETLDLKKPLLPHELKLIAQLLEEAADESARQPDNEFELPDTKRMREMLIDMVLWNNPRLAGRPDLLAEAIPDKSETEDFFLMRWLAHRVREALAADLTMHR